MKVDADAKFVTADAARKGRDDAAAVLETAFGLAQEAQIAADKAESTAEKAGRTMVMAVGKNATVSTGAC